MYDWISTEWLGLLADAGIPEIWVPLITLGALMGINVFMVTFGLGIMSTWGGVDLAGNLDALGNFWPMVGSGVGFVVDQIIDKIPIGADIYNLILMAIRIPVGGWMGGAMMGGVEGVTIGGIAGIFSMFNTQGLAGHAGAEISAWATGILKIISRWIGLQATAPILSILEDVGVFIALGGMYAAGMLT